jgi:CPA2 family monovalent cation:H+ antiporter-2
MRDLFSAMFFAFVGLSVDPSSIPPVLLPAVVLAAITLGTKFATGWIGARRLGVGIRGRTRAGAMLTPRGEFSIAIAGLATAAGVVADFEALAISYVFVLAIAGPIFVRFANSIGEALTRRSSAQTARTG